MKKTVCIITALLLIIGLSSCAGNNAGGVGTDAGNGSGSVASPVTDASVSASEATGDFAVANNIGWLGKNDAPYCITRDDFTELGLTPGDY